MAFTQTMTVQASSAQPLADLIEGWHRDQAGVAPGYQGARLLAARDGAYVVEVDFASEEEAQQNDARPETQAWADKLKGLAEGEPVYNNYQVVYTTR